MFLDCIVIGDRQFNHLVQAQPAMGFGKGQYLLGELWQVCKQHLL